MTITMPTPANGQVSPNSPRAARLPAIAAALITAAALAACGHATTTNSSATPGANATATTAQSKPGATANATTVTTVDGKQVAIPGATPTAVLFFSYNCGQCVEGGKSLAAARAAVQKNGGNAGFLAVDMDPKDAPGAVARYLDQIDGKNVPAAAADSGAGLVTRFQIAETSSVIVVDPAGQVTFRGQAPSSDQILAALGKSSTQ